MITKQLKVVDVVGTVAVTETEACDPEIIHAQSQFDKCRVLLDL